MREGGREGGQWGGARMEKGGKEDHEGTREHQNTKSDFWKKPFS